jgi:hypothetical protein
MHCNSWRIQLLAPAAQAASTKQSVCACKARPKTDMVNSSENVCNTACDKHDRDSHLQEVSNVDRQTCLLSTPLGRHLLLNSHACKHKGEIVPEGNI